MEKFYTKHSPKEEKKNWGCLNSFRFKHFCQIGIGDTRPCNWYRVDTKSSSIAHQELECMKRVVRQEKDLSAARVSETQVPVTEREGENFPQVAPLPPKSPEMKWWADGK